MVSQRSGTIVVTGSVAANLSFPYGGAYSASKASVHATFDALRVEVAPFGIKVVRTLAMHLQLMPMRNQSLAHQEQSLFKLASDRRPFLFSLYLCFRRSLGPSWVLNNKFLESNPRFFCFFDGRWLLRRAQLRAASAIMQLPQARWTGKYVMTLFFRPAELFHAPSTSTFQPWSVVVDA